jgi:hypothetical protein
MTTRREILANVVEFDSDEWNQALADVQDEIGVDDGGFASLFFSGRNDEWEEAKTPELRLIIVETYVSAEKDWTDEEGILSHGK